MAAKNILAVLAALFVLFAAQPASATNGGECYLAIDQVRMGVDSGGQLNAVYPGGANADPIHIYGSPIGRLGFRYDNPTAGTITSTEQGAPNEGWGASAALSSNGTIVNVRILGGGSLAFWGRPVEWIIAIFHVACAKTTSPPLSQCIQVWYNNKFASIGNSNANYWNPAPTYSATPGPDNTTCTAVSDSGAFTVTHYFEPSGVPNVFRITVNITNTAGEPLDNVSYRRMMDWDVDPATGVQRYDNYITIDWYGGQQPTALTTWGNGAGSSMNPLTAPVGAAYSGTSHKVNTVFTKVGPYDQAAVLTFNFGTLAAGATKSFKLFYGAGPNETTALQSLADTGSEVYSVAYASATTSPYAIKANGPGVFFFGFAGVGGVPADIDECLAQTNPCGSNTVCTNVVGGPNSYTCACVTGYTSPTSDGRNCVANPPPGPNPPPPGPNPPTPPPPSGPLTSPGDYLATAHTDAQLEVQAPGVLTGVTGGDGHYTAAIGPKAAAAGTVDEVSANGGFLYTPPSSGSGKAQAADMPTETTFSVNIKDGAGGSIERKVVITIVSTPAPLPPIEVNTFDLRPRSARGGATNKDALRGLKCGATPVKADTTITAGALKLLAGGEVGAPAGVEFKFGKPPASRGAALAAPSADAGAPGKVASDGTCVVRLPKIKLNARQSMTKQSVNCYQCMQCLKALDMAWCVGWLLLEGRDGSLNNHPCLRLR
jgi:hypothetical protein